jgi:dihydrolipoamide dehydrogenase
MQTDFDVIIIGSGPGGYVAAVRAAQLGLRAAIIEKYNILGGTCTVVGCIPAKALLDASEHYYDLNHKMAKMGILAKGASLDFAKFIERKENVVKENSDGVSYLMRKNKIQVFRGIASFLNDRQLRVKGNDGTETILTANYYIIATGSKPATIPGIGIDKDRLITSTEALSLKEKPKTMVIIGGGVIGVEMASVYSRIGTLVTIIEYANTLIPTMDSELGKDLQKILSKQGIEILVGCRVKSAKNMGSGAVVSFTDPNGTEEKITADYCLVAVGRKPYTAGLGLENTNIRVDDKGRIITNEQLQTAVPDVYAIGDVVAGPMLAHKAEEEGILAVETIKGHKPHLNYLLIPSVVYTWPEVSGVGYTENQLKDKGIGYRKGKFPFFASGRARAADDVEGFVKILADPRYGEILGVHVIGARSADLIQQAAIAMRFEITDVELGKMTYPHPTFSEILKDGYLESCGCGAINI